MGLLVAFWGIDLLVSLGGLGVPRSRETRIDVLVFAVALGSMVLTGLLFGLAPALRGSRTTIHGALSDGERVATGRDALRNAVIVGEVGLALVLLIGAGLFLRSLESLHHVDPGFTSENLLTMRLSLPPSHYPEDRRAAFFEQLLEKVAHLPSVRAVAASSALPPDKRSILRLLRQPGAATQACRCSFGQLLRGEPGLLPDHGHLGRRWTGVHGLGSGRSRPRRCHQPDDGPPILPRRGRHRAKDPRRKCQCSAARDRRHRRRRQAQWPPEDDPQIYQPFLQNPYSTMGLALGWDGDVQQLTDAVRRQVASLDADLPIFDVSTMSGSLARSLAPQRSYAVVLVVFASLALSLATIGIYGVISYAVAQRTHEIGIRAALGATRRDILRLVVGHGLRLLACGLCLGLLAAFVLTRLLTTMLFGVSPTDLRTYAALSILLTAVTLVACYLPARRAARVDPAVALRSE